MRNKRSKKLLSVLLTLAMLATLMVSMVGPASASATYTTGTVEKVSAGDRHDLGSVKVSIPASELDKAYFFTLRLPTDFEFDQTKDLIRVPGAGNYLADNADILSVAPSYTSANEVKISLKAAADIAGDKNDNRDTAFFYVDLKNVLVASGFNGEVTATVEGQSGSPFVDGTITVATVGSGISNITIDGVNDITTSGDNNKIDIIRLKEDRPGALEDGQYIKFKLPSGFKWNVDDLATSFNDGKLDAATGLTKDNVSVNADYSKMTAAEKAACFVNITNDQDDNRSLVITSHKDTYSSAYMLLDKLKVVVDDETVAKTGDVQVTISGTASSNPGTLVVAKYGEYGSKSYAVGDPETVLAGRDGSANNADDKFTQIGKFAIEETMEGTLIKDRTITLTLSSGAKWAKDSNDQIKDITPDTANSENQDVIGNTWKVIGSTGDTARLSIAKDSTNDAVKAVFKNAKIIVAGDASQDISLTVGGSAGVTGEFVVAKVASPVTLTVDGNVPSVKIGEQGQELASMVVTENMPEAIKGGSYKDSDGNDKQYELMLEFPDGVTPSNPTSVEVAGDLVLDQNSIGTKRGDNGRWYVTVGIKSTSSQPSKVTVKGVKVTTDRTVPEGAMIVKVKGDAVLQTANIFKGATSVANGTIANCATPAPVEQKATTTFKIGDTKFSLNGVEQTMDAAPYIKNDRTFLPIRYVAKAVGVDENNIMWNAEERSVVLVKGDRVVKLVIGSNAMLINGVALTMDTAPEVVDPGRTMLPVSWIAKAVGADIQWDAATQTVTVN